MKNILYHIGSNKLTNEIYIVNDSVSSSHAQLFVDENNQIVIIDLLSKNGTLVNGRKIFSPVTLSHTDVISIGNFIFNQFDLLQAITKFDFENKNSIQKNILLVSTINNNMLNKNNRITGKKIGFITLVILCFVMLTFGATIVIDQKSKEIIFQKISKYDYTSSEKLGGNSINSKPSIKVIKKQRTDVVYDFSCLETNDDNGSNKAIYNFGELTRNVQSSVLKDIPITISDEKKDGDNLLKEYKNEYKFITSGNDIKKLNLIMLDLVSRLAKPRGISYEIHFIDDPLINVLTSGGHIFFFKGMYEMCKSNSEIAAVIAHEIAHNELGHLTLALKKQKKSNDYGILGEIFLGVESAVTVSFNQKQETEADFFGMDLVYPTDYNTCDAINLWHSMSKLDGEFNVTENFFRSHPYSKNRGYCIENHLDTNYNQRCNN